MIKHQHLREHVIQPACKKIFAYDEFAEELLVFTACIESDAGTYLHQINGPALGIYGCEPNTHNDAWNNWLPSRPELIDILFQTFRVRVGAERLNMLVYDLHYATAMARIHYLRVQEHLPDPSDPEAIFNYYKKYYNSVKGKSDKNKCIEKYLNYIGKPMAQSEKKG